MVYLENYKEIKTLEDLLSINYKHVSVNDQLRGNLITKLKSQQFPYSGIIGYDDDIVPSLNRAILSSHDMLLVGQIGQAKTKIAETVAKNLLSPIPIVEGSITNDIPTLIPESEMLVSLLNDKEITRSRPEFYVSTETEDKIRNNKLDTKIVWIDGPKSLQISSCYTRYFCKGSCWSDRCYKNSKERSRDLQYGIIFPGSITPCQTRCVLYR